MALLAVQGHRVIALVLHPEPILEPLAERLCLGEEPLGQIRLAADRGEAGHPTLRVVDVALDLRERDGHRRAVSGPIADGVAGILPTLVQQAPRRTPLVLDEP